MPTRIKNAYLRPLSCCALLLCALPASVVSAQDNPTSHSDDSELEAASPAEIRFRTPDSPVRSAQEELKTFQLDEGFRVELVASEPLIQDPVAITFDPDGRLWVCEMRGFMPNIDGIGEEDPVGVISVLTDSDGDGRMDQSTIFLDGLVLPRGLCWTLDGLLVCERGNIWLCQDTNHDDRCDHKRVICTYNEGNLEHSLNGLMPALDNWIYNAKEGVRLRRSGEQWVSDDYAARGQWGITQDDFGYLRYNVNASLLRGDLVPCYSSIAQHPNPLVDVPLYKEQILYPIRPTPGINRGYIPGFLRPDGSLVEANSNCGPVVYRGDNLPQEMRGDVFIPEPAGNLVRRQLLEVNGLQAASRNAYERVEFMASTDERFRPVNMFNAPDGTLYIVDLYRGIIQHGDFITPYLREQILQRKLDRGIHLGRIWRIVHETTQPRSPAALSKLSSLELIPYLSHTNGWHRDMAQQLIVQRNDVSVVDELEVLATSGTSSLARLHAIWSLEGLGKLDAEVLYKLLSDSDPNLRASAATLYQRLLSVETLQLLVLEDVSELAEDENALVQMQVLQTLGRVDSTEVEDILGPILQQVAQNDKLLIAALSGFTGQLTEFVAKRLAHPSWIRPDPWKKELLSQAAGILWRQREPLAILRFCHLLDAIPAHRDWQLIALLEGIRDPERRRRRPKFPPYPGQTPVQAPEPAEQSDGPLEPRLVKLRLDAAPAAVDRLRKSENPRLAMAAEAFADRLIWPGKDGKSLPEKRRLTEEQQRLFEIGRREYASLCAGCHHPAGYGLVAKGPPLLGSAWLENEPALIRILLHGLEGPINAPGGLYNEDGRLNMPAMSKALDDEQLAGVLTYIRREFAEDASPVEIYSVAELRRQLSDRSQSWTEREVLEAVK